MRLLRELIHKGDINFLSIQETILQGDASGIVKCLLSHRNFSNYCVPSQGRLGGLLCTWKTDSFSAISAFSGQGFLGAIGRWTGCSKYLTLINVYAPQERSMKQKLWADLLARKATSNSLFCIINDFNAVRCESERKGSNFDEGKTEDFNKFISQSNLLNLSLGSKKYTWIGQGGFKAQ